MLPDRIARMAWSHRSTKSTNEMIMQTAKIHREMVKGMVGLIWPAQREKASRLTAVKVSTA